MRRFGPLAILFVALILSAARCPPQAENDGGNPEPSTPAPDAGVIDAGPRDAGSEPEEDAGPIVEPEDAGICIPDPGGPPSDDDSYAYFAGTGMAAHFSACANCHFGGSPSGIGIAWGPSGDQTPEGWFIAAIGNYQGDLAANPNVTPQGTDLYRTTANDHQGKQANAAVADDVVDWITYISTVTPEVICPDPPPVDAGTPDAGAPDAGPVDAGAPDAGPGDAGPPPVGVPGVLVAIAFLTDPFTIPRDTCVPTVTTVGLVDYLGNPAQMAPGSGEIRISLTSAVGPVLDPATFWSDLGCVNTRSDNVTFVPGISQRSFRWK